MTRYIVLSSILVLSSCTLTDMITPTTPVQTGSVSQTGTTTTGSLDHQEPLVEDISGSGGMYYPIFDGLETKTIRVKHEAGVPTIVSFINSEAKAVEISISFPNASGANLRWSQVVMPDGTMDGPFGQHVGYNLTQFGGYEFRFSENQMAGEPWSGEADITITLLDTPYENSAVILD